VTQSTTPNLAKLITHYFMNIELSEDQVSLILYCLEGYVQGNDDEDLINEVDDIFKILENV